jgi:hypothetical protein
MTRIAVLIAALLTACTDTSEPPDVDTTGPVDGCWSDARDAREVPCGAEAFCLPICGTDVVACAPACNPD